MINLKTNRLLIGLIFTTLTFATFISCKVDEPIKQYTIIFHSNGGTTIENLIMNSGEPLIKPIDPTKSDSIFDGWFIDEGKTEPFTFGVTYYTTLGFDLYAKWAKACNINFNTDGGTVIPLTIVNSGKYIIKPNDPIKLGYLFGGWFADSNFTNLFDFSVPASIDITIYAKWNMIQYYPITFESNGGTSVASQSIKSGEFATKPTISNVGKTLVGWYTDNAFTFPYDFYNTAISASITLYAKWATTSPESDFTFDASNGTITVYKGTQTNIVIPESIGGVPVTSIGYKLFENKQINSVVLPSSIIEFESKSEGNFATVSRAFQGCSAKEVNLFNTAIVTLPKWAFGSAKIEQIELPGTLTQLQQGSFEGATIKSIVIPNSVKYIEQYSFFRCKSITKATIGTGALLIGNGTFAECSLFSELIVTRNILPVTTLAVNDNNPFRDVASSLNIKVPMNVLGDYKSFWPSVADKITGY